ncbi:unnamed protein product [Anisakis simplex]|uniref:Serum response factor-binding protein 1 n=1 Tax=Anisakis simplex TaxID=6269 RepID=A0A0M3JV96_ANISI|nr:unnamed protein product [Anisakis simplex]
MRKVVDKARVRLCRRLVRQQKTLKESKNEKKKRKTERLVEEFKACKGLRRDDVSKFALLNLKSLKDLNIRGSTPVQERLLYKLASEQLIVDCVAEFRRQYPEWNLQAPFLLQRLGLQYRWKRKPVKATISNEDKSNEQITHDSDDGGDTEKELSDNENIEEVTQIKQVPKNELKKEIVREKVAELVAKKVKNVARKEESHIKKTKKKQQKAGITLEKSKIELPKPIIAPNALRRGQGIIRKLIMDGSNDNNNNDTDEIDAVSSGESHVIVSTTQRGEGDEEEKHRNEDEHWLFKTASAFQLEPSDQQQQEHLRTKQKYLSNKSKLRSQSDAVHPSWAAKRRETERIAELSKLAKKGKKVVFNDDD